MDLIRPTSDSYARILGSSSRTLSAHKGEVRERACRGTWRTSRPSSLASGDVISRAFISFETRLRPLDSRVKGTLILDLYREVPPGDSSPSWGRRPLLRAGLATCSPEGAVMCVGHLPGAIHDDLFPSEYSLLCDSGRENPIQTGET